MAFRSCDQGCYKGSTQPLSNNSRPADHFSHRRAQIRTLKALRPADERVRREGRRALHLANARIDARAQNLGDPSTAPCAGANADQLAPSAAECWACKRRAAPLLRTPVPKCPSAQKDCRERAPPPAPCAWPPAAPDLVEKSTNRDRRSAGVGRRFDLSRSFPRERVVPGVPQGA